MNPSKYLVKCSKKECNFYILGKYLLFNFNAYLAEALPHKNNVNQLAWDNQIWNLSIVSELIENVGRDLLLLFMKRSFFYLKLEPPILYNRLTPVVHLFMSSFTYHTFSLCFPIHMLLKVENKPPSYFAFILEC